MGTVCPTVLKVTEKVETVSVKFWKTHFGNETEELRRITIDKVTRIKVAGNIYFNYHSY